MISSEGPSRITFYLTRFSVGLLPKSCYHGWYRDTYKGSDSTIKVINLGRILRLAWW